jgi:transglutaminase-like putative cysteine protease
LARLWPCAARWSGSGGRKDDTVVARATKSWKPAIVCCGGRALGAGTIVAPAILGGVDERDSAPPPHRDPPALLPPSAARLGGFAALALLGALQWQRMVDGLSSGHAFLWVLVAAAAAAAVLWADRPRRFRGTATLAVAVLALLAAYMAAGLDLDLLKPRRLDELGAGLAHGTEALASAQMPYRGADRWPSLTLQLLGALLCVLAGLLAFWPREGGRGYQFLSLALLLVLVAAPVVSLGGTEPVALGVVLTALTVCFLWLERLPLKPGLGIAAMLALALTGALPLASAADGEEPWFDYKEFAESLGPDEPLRFDWGHSYGDITWPRDGAEVLRVDARRPSYWKVADLDEFDGEGWVDTGSDSDGEADPALDLARDWQARPGWTETLRVSLRRIETANVIAAGTTLAVEDTGRPVRPSSEPGLWRSDRTLQGGDSYTVRAHVPKPSPAQLAQSTSGVDPRQSSSLDLEIPTEVEALPPELEAAGDAAAQESRRRLFERMRLTAELRFEPFEPFGRADPPRATYQTLARSNDGDAALDASPYAETWALAQRLMRESRTPYDYVVGVDRFLQDGFRYDETPDPVSPGRAPLDGFLFETKSGYCQHYSAAMAILLRMGGVPARVVTGFSPGGYSKRKQAWIVRDTDAHSWVEAWFDEFGWVTFDPTPAGTPARSQIAALERPPEPGEDSDDEDSDDASGSAPRTGGVRPDLLGPQSGQAGGGRAASADGGPPWWSIAVPVALLVALAAWLALRWRRRSMSPAAALDRAIAELEAALRRLGRPATAGLTLAQLEQRHGRSPEAAAYLRALRAGRYAPTSAAPTLRGRRALRRELGSGAGPRGRLRALWALPPWRA